jgi:hypothetical protein
MHAWEWLQDRERRLLKTDAIDHARAHDLVGCQDIAWDIAGAIVELRLAPEDVEKISIMVERESRHGIDPLLIRFLTLCYAAFQAGYYALAERALAFSPEARRLHEAKARYETNLRFSLGFRC